MTIVPATQDAPIAGARRLLDAEEPPGSRPIRDSPVSPGVDDEQQEKERQGKDP